EGHVHAAQPRGDVARALDVRDRHAHQLAAGLLQGADLAQRGRGVARVGVGHRLHAHLVLAADHQPADRNLDRLASRDGFEHLSSWGPGVGSHFSPAWPASTAFRSSFWSPRFTVTVTSSPGWWLKSSTE